MPPQGFVDIKYKTIPQENIVDIKYKTIPQENIVDIKYEMIPDENKLLFFKSKRGHPRMIYNGYEYSKHSLFNSGAIYWRCMERSRISCKSTMLAIGDEILRESGEHNHSPPIGIYPISLSNVVEIKNETMPDKNELIFIKTKLGHPRVIYKGYEYHKNRLNNSGDIHWRCIELHRIWRCKSSIHTIGDEILRESGEHNHSPRIGIYPISLSDVVDIKYETMPDTNKVIFIKTKHGHPRAIYKGYVYRKSTLNNSGDIYWRCIELHRQWRCKSSIHTIGDQILKESGEHNHSPRIGIYPISLSEADDVKTKLLNLFSLPRGRPPLGGPYHCADCGKSYTQKYNLVNHKKNDCGVKKLQYS
ncbi:hypothetical protein O3M35_011175 [Rhynocoris fuscipes]|uniref:C2H2-type domain-containing protein n=1 Tax=Rhynocoris fuscipes TaxID=488301 RepID=A0AAW1D0H9_9HEMI